MAHRLMWRLAYGEHPGLLKVCHKCDNRQCVNPSHLFIGTQKDNVADMIRKNRRAESPRGEMNFKSKLNDEAVRQIRAASGPLRPLANQYGVSVDTIRSVRAGATWGHVR